jgi:ribosomal protein S18 acetylase RimI-like enzyme
MGEVRPARRQDRAAVLSICVATARAGEPVAADDPAARLLPAVYAEPYLVLEPASAHVLVDDAGLVVGYAVGTAHSPAFVRAWQQRWTPRFPPPGDGDDEVAQLLTLLHEPQRMLPDAATLAAFPSHLHLDLLPRARGHGYGRTLLETTLDGFAAAGSPGVHLGVAWTNERAMRFYDRAGFSPATVQPLPQTVVLVRPLRATAGG